MWDRATGLMRYAYTTDDGDVANDQSTAGAISADGSTVLVHSWATNLGGPPVQDGAIMLRFGKKRFHRLVVRN